MAIAPERLEVLSRLGIVKGGAADGAFSAASRVPELSTIADDDAFRTLPAESSAFQRGLRTLADKPVLLFIIVCAITAAGAFAVLHFSNAPAATVAAVTPAPVDPAGTEASSNAASTPDLNTAAAAAPTTGTARPNTTARIAAPLASPSPAPRTPKVAPALVNNAPVTASAPQRQQTLQTRAIPPSEVAPAVPAIVPAAGDEAPAFVDQAIYTSDNADVRPPRLVSEQLPTPAIGGWTTRTNAIEVLVSQDGSVEHARFIAAPQRMPDMFVLSRAKMWKFVPALKDGQPVRYRVVLTWQVNP